MSDQYVSVPRELLEKALKADASQGATAMDLHHGWLAMKVLRHALNQELAAPAEDARAVVDEPVALKRAFEQWYSRNPYEDLTHATLAYMAFQAGASFHPQRPVVMPKRRTADSPEINQNGHLWWREEKAADFNACLDEFARLNPQ